jgi:hypothetical protein
MDGTLEEVCGGVQSDIVAPLGVATHLADVLLERDTFALLDGRRVHRRTVEDLIQSKKPNLEKKQ